MKKLAFMLMLVFFCFQSLAQQQNQWRNYLDPTPLPNVDFVKSSQSLWIATRGGLVEFNTLTEKHKIYQPDSCAIKGVQIRSVCADTANGVWFSTNTKGLQHFDGTTFRYFHTKNNGESLNYIKKIQLDKQGRVWMLHLTTDVGAIPKAEILMFDGQNWTSFLRDSLLFEEEFAVDKDGICWFNKYGFSPSYDHRIMSFDTRSGQMMRFDSLNSAVRLTTNTPLIRTDESGNTWLSYGEVNKNIQLHQLKITGWKNFKLVTNTGSSLIKSLSFGNDGSIYVIDNWHIRRMKDSIWTINPFYDFEIQKLLPIDSVKAWVIGYDLDKYALFRIGNTKRFSFIDEKTIPYNSTLNSEILPIFGNHPRNNNLYNRTLTFDGRTFKPNSLYGIQGAFDGDSLLWMSGNPDVRFFDFRTNVITTIPSPNDRGINPIKILVDKFATKWVIGNNRSFMYAIDRNRTIKSYNFFSFTLNFPIRDFAIDSSNNIWAIGDSGLIKRNSLTEIWSIIPLPDSVRRFLSRINIDEGNHIWLDANSSCYKYSEQNGLKYLDWQNIILTNNNYFSVNEKFVSYRNNVWWFATYYGLVRYDGHDYQTFNEINSPMPTKRISSLFTDKLGNLWMNHIYGLTVFNENNLIDLRTTVKDIAKQEEIFSKVSPNPLSKNGFLSFENLDNSPFLLTIFDAHGKIMRSQMTRENLFSIQTHDFPNGIYFYMLKNKERIGRGKFVVQQ